MQRIKHIASADNPQYKALLKLAQHARTRAKQGSAVLEGAHLLQAALQHNVILQTLAVSAGGLERAEIRGLLDQLAMPALALSDALFKKLSTVETPTGVLAVIARPAPAMPALSEPALDASVILLEDIQDAGNLGSILRSAAAAGIADVFVSKNSVDVWSPRVLRAAQGAHFALTIHEDSDLVAVARAFQGKMLATQPGATASLYETDLHGHVAFAFGNEGAGLSAALAAAAKISVEIPLAAGVESLNVAAAAAVCLFEWRRQNPALLTT